MQIFIKSQLGRILLLLFILQTLDIANGDGTLCNQVFNYDAYFSVSLLKQNTHFSYKIYNTLASQGTFTYNITDSLTNVVTDTNFSSNGYDLVFNFCQYVSYYPNQTSYCPDKMNSLPQNTYAMLVPLDPSGNSYGNSCTTLIQPTYLASGSKFDNYQFDLIDSDKPQNGYIYQQYFPQQRIVNNNGTSSVLNYNNSITYIIRCDKSETQTLNIKGWRYISNTTYFGIFLETTSQYGCPTLQLSRLWQILSDNSIIFTITMVTIGAALCFFGLKLYKPTLFIIGYITGFGGIVAIMGEFVIRYDSDSIMAYACLIIAVLFGVLTGYVTVSLPKVGFFALGMWLGIVLALLFNNAFLYKIQVENQFVVLWITIAILAIFMGLMSFFFYRHCVMVCTGFIGSYCLIRPFGWILGDFPNELQIAQELKYGQISSVPNLFYLYFALILLVGAIGIKFQYSMYFSRRQQEEENDLQLYLADPDFIDMNKSLLDKNDEDLTTKEKKTKEKLIRMQKNVEKEKKRQEKFMRRADRLKRREKGEEVSDDSEDSEEDEDNSENGDSDDEKGRKSKRSKTKSKDLELFGAISKKDSRRKSKVKSIKKQNSNSSNEDQQYGGEDHIIERQENKKFSNLFAGIKKNKKLDQDEDRGIEMDDLSEHNYQDTTAKKSKENPKDKKQAKQQDSDNDDDHFNNINKNSDKEKSDKSDNSDSENDKKKKKSVKDIAKLAKSQKKKK
ncbi:hypothetical protein ABPG72_015789 [Tetrahymena utriculariae]